jgi:hypothetical protein
MIPPVALYTSLCAATHSLNREGRNRYLAILPS